MPSEKRKKLDEEKKIKTKNNLINSAIEIFIKKGYHQTNISDIVAFANLGQGTFYRNFSSKREIFEEILKKMIEELIFEFSDGSLKINEMPISFDEYKDKSIKAFLKIIPIIKKNKKVVILFFRDAPTIDKEFEQEINDIFEQFSSIAQHYLNHAIKQKFIRTCNSRLVAESIVGMGIQHIKNWLHDKYSDFEIEKVVIEANNLIFLGLLTPSV